MTSWTEEQEIKIKRFYDNELPSKQFYCKECQAFSPTSICNSCGKPELDLKCILYTEDSCKHSGYVIPQRCPVCGEMICPDCGSHNIQIVSRVTGYLSPVSNWSKGKQQELFDRTRNSIPVRGF